MPAESWNSASKSPFHLSHCLALLVVSRSWKNCTVFSAFFFASSQVLGICMHAFSALDSSNERRPAMSATKSENCVPQVWHLCSGFQLFSTIFFFPTTFIAIRGRATEWARELERQQARLVIEFAKFSWLDKLVWSLFLTLFPWPALLSLEAQIVANYIWRWLKNVIWYAQIFNMNTAEHTEKETQRARDSWANGNGKVAGYELLEYHGKIQMASRNIRSMNFAKIPFGESECCINYLWDFYHFVSRIQFRFLSHAIYMLLSIPTSWLMSLAGDTQLSSITGQGSELVVFVVLPLNFSLFGFTVSLYLSLQAKQM